MHFFNVTPAESIKYKSKKQQGREPKIPERDRVAHAKMLVQKFNSIWQGEKSQKEQRKAQSLKSRNGSYIEFISSADHDLITKSLENVKQGKGEKYEQR